MFSVSKIEHYLISKTDGTWIFPSMCLFRASFAKEQQRHAWILRSAQSEAVFICHAFFFQGSSAPSALFQPKAGVQTKKPANKSTDTRLSRAILPPGQKYEGANTPYLLLHRRNGHGHILAQFAIIGFLRAWLRDHIKEKGAQSLLKNR